MQEFENFEENLDLSENNVNVEDSVSGSSTKQVTVKSNQAFDIDNDSENDADADDNDDENVIVQDFGVQVDANDDAGVQADDDIVVQICDDSNTKEDEQHRRRYHTTINDRVVEINNKLKSIDISRIKYKSLQYEKDSLTDPQSSEETINNVNKVLSGKKNPVACPHCGKFFEMGKGLKLHIAKKH